VGWDDNYDRNNFLITAPGDGAFIVRNSYGTEVADAGYFYISYYDEVLGYAQPDLGYFPVYYVFMKAEPVDNYKQIYQYDPFGLVQDISSSKTGCSKLNL
jgi:C1A family cysteine protease